VAGELGKGIRSFRDGLSGKGETADKTSRPKARLQNPEKIF